MVMLICAPTGSGKTNVAMLAIQQEIRKHRNPRTGEIALDGFRIIFIAPLKALTVVQAQVGQRYCFVFSYLASHDYVSFQTDSPIKPIKQYLNANTKLILPS
jgi:superfamily II DNA or RNA helicase